MAPIANNKDGNAGAEVIDSPTQHVTQDKTKENNTLNHPKKNDAPNNNTSNNEQHAHQLNDDTDEEFRHKRAQGRWNFVKGLCNRHADLEHKTLFKSGEKISLTTAEATFLNMMTQSKLNGNNEKQSVSSVLSGESSSSAATRRKSHFLDAVKAAVAKERLRDSLAERLAHLSGPEVKFLTKLVNNEDVSLGALENAVHVLDNDPIYNPTLRSADEEEEEEKEVKDGVLSGNGSITSFSEKTEDRRNQFKRRSSLIEKSMWKISTYGMDEATGNDEGSIGSERLSVSVNDRRSKFNRKSSHHEKSMWDISTRGKYSKQTAPEKESMQGNASGVKKNFQAVGEDGAATKKSSKDGTVDDQPMEPTMANEAEQKLDSRDEKNEGSIKLVGLDELLSSLREKMSSSSSLKSEKVKAPQKITMDRYSFLCCGLESMSFGERNDLEKPEDDLIHNAEDDADADSLESKKRFLHLKTTDTVDRHEHLSTWLGSPDDYPILGLKTKAIDHDDDDNDVEEEEEDVEEHDPLDPHVLSPLLMKCLRDHLPYALREENFWLKYSLVRDVSELKTNRFLCFCFCSTYQ